MVKIISKLIVLNTYDPFPPCMTNNKILVASAQGELDGLIRSMGYIPRTDISRLHETEAITLYAAKNTPSLALVDGSLREGLALCRDIRNASPLTRIFYFTSSPIHPDELHTHKKSIDEVYVRGEQSEHEIAQAIDGFLERAEERILQEKRL